MKIWKRSGRALQSAERDASPLGPEDVRVRLECAALTECALRQPLLAGFGTVVETGEAATALAGKSVAVPAVDACGECPTCRRGMAPLCPQAQRGPAGEIPGQRTARARWVLPIEPPIDLTPANAALAIGPLLYSYAWLTQTGAGPGDPVIVLGEAFESRALRQIARTRGAKVAEGRDADSIEASLREQQAETAPRKIFASSPSDAQLLEALALPGSTISLGASIEPFPTGLITQRSLTVVGYDAPHPELAAEVAGLLVKGLVEGADALIDCTVDDELPEGRCCLLRLPTSA
jgi:D-arabinose 1-dehydrogenase-like Zn-dependent alcohol dehydrogenase